MKQIKTYLLALLAAVVLFGCASNEKKDDEQFKFLVDRFSDLQVLQYKVPGFESLTLKEKKLAYYLYEAALSGRDIMFDQNYKHNLYIRRTLENIVATFGGDRTTKEFESFMIYTKRVWFANGIHHHYGNQKFSVEFSKEYFAELVKNSDQKKFPLQKGESVEQMLVKMNDLIFNLEYDEWNINNNDGADIVANSANNYYENVNEKEVIDFYKKTIDANDPRPVSYGLNSKLIKENGTVKEVVWKSGGMYGKAIDKIIYWLEKAATVAENETQKIWLEHLTEYYRTGDLRKFDEFNVVWAGDTKSNIDAVNGFIETYGDPLGYRAAFESVVSFKDVEATKRTETISKNALWFEQNSTTLGEHKKGTNDGVSGKVITVFAQSGACLPTLPLGINLPNSNWIRAEHGSKSVNLGNLDESYAKAAEEAGGSTVDEFYYSDEVKDRVRKYGDIAGTMMTDLHEIIGHGSGKLEPGVGTPKETLKNYSAIIEEARADLAGLSFITDPKLIELGLMPDLEIEVGLEPNVDPGKSGIDGYIQNGMMGQLRRIKLGDDIQQTHMRERQMISKWVYEKGQPDNVIEKIVENGKTYFVVRDYKKVRELFGELFKEIQRIKSQGDYEAAKNLIETYGIKIDQDLHKEVLDRYKSLNRASYSGFLTPMLKPVKDGNDIVDVKIEYHNDFVKQMMWLAENYSFLPCYN